jgi:hypothetical protein
MACGLAHLAEVRSPLLSKTIKAFKPASLVAETYAATVLSPIFSGAEQGRTLLEGGGGSLRG